ncbi:MAG: hypothetical protein KA243_00820 [Candidatus Aminicenantes bacterium]|nr:hypothetical protein [Candidatus Aminicenantes bacterium]NLH76318.1 hypothetical protein [Acidobacteriota bacterium]
MRHATKAAAALLALALTAAGARAAETALTIKGGYFTPSDAVFRDVYGGGPAFGLDLAVPVAGPLRAWAGVELFSKRGLTTESEETTKVTITPLFAGLRLQFGRKGVRPYLGAAAAYFLFKERNALGAASESGLGALGQAGLVLLMGRSFGLDVHAGYRACTLTAGDAEDPLEAKIGGLSAGLGFVVRF